MADSRWGLEAVSGLVKQWSLASRKLQPNASRVVNSWEPQSQPKGALSDSLGVRKQGELVST